MCSLFYGCKLETVTQTKLSSSFIHVVAWHGGCCSTRAWFIL
jgi:hypothetical protein